MPFRLDGFKAKIQFVGPSWMPHRVYRACLATGTVSNTRYIQEAVCERLARDLGLDLAELLAGLPRSRGPSGHLYDPDSHGQSRPGNLNAQRNWTVEEVR